VPVADAVDVADAPPEAVADPVTVTVPLMVDVAVLDGECVTVLVPEPDCVADSVGADGVPVAVVVPVGVGVSEVPDDGVEE